MLEQTTMALADAMGRWHEFYAELGTASATLVGLLFVAATVGSGVFSPDRRAPMRVFLSASVVHFSGILAVSLIVLAPVRSWFVFGPMILAGGVFGLVYCGLVFRDVVRDGLSKSIDHEDRFWYVIVPFIGYFVQCAAGAMLAARLEMGCIVLAAAEGMLMLIGVHNAWDITIWMISRRRE